MLGTCTENQDNLIDNTAEKLTDKFVADIDKAVEAKTKDIMKV